MAALTFRVLDIVAEPYTVAPQLTARLEIEESTGTTIHAIALRSQVRIEPQRRAVQRVGGSRPARAIR